MGHHWGNQCVSMWLVALTLDVASTHWANSPANQWLFTFHAEESCFTPLMHKMGNHKEKIVTNDNFPCLDHENIAANDNLQFLKTLTKLVSLMRHLALAQHSNNWSLEVPSQCVTDVFLIPAKHNWLLPLRPLVGWTFCSIPHSIHWILFKQQSLWMMSSNAHPWTHPWTLFLRDKWCKCTSVCEITCARIFLL